MPRALVNKAGKVLVVVQPEDQPHDSKPKYVAGMLAILPAQQAIADLLQSYCPDLDQWPRSWAYKARDIPYGLRTVECCKPFLREMLARSLSRKTLRQHLDNIWILGGSPKPSNSFDATCRKLFRFFTVSAISRRQNARSSAAATNRSRH